MKPITVEWLKEQNTCKGGIEWFKNQRFRKPLPILKSLIEQNKLDWANWFIIRVMARPQYLKYAIFAAEKALPIYQEKYPNDKRCIAAIQAAKTVLKNDTAKNREAAEAAAAEAAWVAARAAAEAAWAAWAAAAKAAWVVARVVEAVGAAEAVWVAEAAEAAEAVGAATRAAARVAGNKTFLEILHYGIKLLEE